MIVLEEDKQLFSKCFDISAFFSQPNRERGITHGYLYPVFFSSNTEKQNIFLLFEKHCAKFAYKSEDAFKGPFTSSDCDATQ